MISDEKLARISLAAAIAGLVLLFIAVSLAQPENVAISQITNSYSGRNVIVDGTVKSYSTSEGNIFIKLEDGTGNITAVMFERAARGQTIPLLQKGDNATVQGQVNVYKNEPEIIASSIK